MNTAQRLIDGLRPCTWVWLVLLALTALTLGIGEKGLSGLTVASIVLLLTVIKGKLVVDHFMGLRRVAWLWRSVMYGYLLIVGVLIALAYIVGMG